MDVDLQNDPKINVKNYEKNQPWAPRRPREPPRVPIRRPRELPKWSPRGPRAPKMEPKELPGLPKWSSIDSQGFQNGVQETLRASKMLPKIPPEDPKWHPRDPQGYPKLPKCAQQAPTTDNSNAQTNATHKQPDIPQQTAQIKRPGGMREAVE